MTRTAIEPRLRSAIFTVVALAGGLATLGLDAGCAAPKQVASRATITATSGSVMYGTFVTQSEAQLNPESPLTNIYTVGDAVYAFTKENKVYALSQGLDIRFIDQPAGKFESVRPPVQLGDEVIFPTSVGLKVTSKEGVPLRTIKLPHPLTSDVSVDQRGLLLAGTAAPYGGHVSMLDPKRTVRPAQQETLLGNVMSAPTSLQGIVYAANDRGQVYAIGLENHTAWGLEGLDFATGRPILANLVVDDFGLYVAGGDGTLYTLDRTTGRIKWRYMAEVPLTQTPLVTKDRVYQVVPDVGLVALDKLEGKLYRDPLWSADGVTKIISVDDAYVYAVREKGTLVALGVADGKERFSATGRFDYVAAGADNAIFAATADGAIVKLKRGPYTGEAVARK